MTARCDLAPRLTVLAAVVLGLLLLTGTAALAQPVEAPGTIEVPTPAAPAAPGTASSDGGFGITIETGEGGLSRTVGLILLLTVGSVAPALLLLMTTFTRFVVVLGLTKNAIGVPTIPPAQVLVGLALFLTFFSMGPILGQVNELALQPLLAGELDQQVALQRGLEPLRGFMLAQTRESDLQLFVDLSSGARPATPEEIPTPTLIPAFVISELRTAFTIGFVVFVPFLIIDLVVGSVLMSMGMVMLPPVFVSLPLKLLLFVLVDGWALIVGSLVRSVGGVA